MGLKSKRTKTAQCLKCAGRRGKVEAWCSGTPPSATCSCGGNEWIDCTNCKGRGYIKILIPIKKSKKDPVFNWPITKERYRQVLIRKRQYWDKIQKLEKELRKLKGEY